mgnify:CR=1 FL=1
MKKINEIFYSLQGEGFHVGTPAVFVRFSGCNLKCDFCDTQHEQGRMMSDEEILAEVEKYPCRMVILTGGEPGKYVCIETNGTRVLPEGIDWVTCSPKQGSQLCVRRVDEIKVVYQGQEVESYLQIPASAYFLQPCSCMNTSEVVDYIKEHPVWRLSLQIHKLIAIP